MRRAGRAEAAKAAHGMPRVVQTAAKAAAQLIQGDGSYGSSMGGQEG